MPSKTGKGGQPQPRRRTLKVGHPVPSVMRLRTGDVVAVPLRDRGRTFAVGRVFAGAAIGIFRGRWKRPPPADELGALARLPMAFHVGFFCMPSQRPDLDWVYLGELPFESEDAAWPPPSYIEDIICPGTYRIYHRGRMRPATPEQVKGLEAQIMLSPKALRDRARAESADWPRV